MLKTKRKLLIKIKSGYKNFTRTDYMVFTDIYEEILKLGYQPNPDAIITKSISGSGECSDPYIAEFEVIWYDSLKEFYKYEYTQEYVKNPGPKNIIMEHIKYIKSEFGMVDFLYKQHRYDELELGFYPYTNRHNFLKQIAKQSKLTTAEISKNIEFQYAKF